MPIQIGFLGLGTMGTAMANNIRKTGLGLTVWNRSPDRTQPFAAKSVRVAKTPRECAEGRDLVITCVSDERALDAILGGPNGVLAGLKPGDVLVDMSTSGTRAARAIAERVEKRGARFVAAPVLGSRTAAEKAQLVVVAGGPREARERAHPALHAVSARIFEMDDPVQAALLKVCVNAVGGAMMAAFGESLALAATGGVPLGRFIEVLQSSAYHSPLYLMKGEQIVNDDFAPRFALSLQEKDLRLASESAADQGASMPVSAAVRKLYATAAAAGRGDKDLSAVADMLLEWTRSGEAARARGAAKPARRKPAARKAAPKKAKAAARKPAPQRKKAAGKAKKARR
ncbi:MAG TPA: NAD(P)-dependent oxidoreductase [Anaeromyxobacteraceae bacterium]|nr:NAD(P)-dependent oxidoreductase [Anaeromyxobacteraceae bacterium]